MASPNIMNRTPIATTSTPPSPDPLGRRYKSRPLPPLPSPELLDTSDLMPPPLFSSRPRTRTLPSGADTGPYNISSSPTRSSRSQQQSYTPSLRSTTSSLSSASFASTPSTPSAQGSSFSPSPSTSQFKPPSPAPSCYVAVSWDPAPRPSLKRKTAPKKESLRSLRKKQSDDCLQRVYQERTLAYLDGRILAGEGVRLGPLFESWEWEV